MDYTLAPPPLVKGLSIPLLTALDDKGRFDAASQEKLLRFALGGEAGAGAQALFSNGTSGEWHRLPTEVNHQVAQTIQYGLSGSGVPLWMGSSAKSAAGVLGNLEHALKIGAAKRPVAEGNRAG